MRVLILERAYRDCRLLPGLCFGKIDEYGWEFSPKTAHGYYWCIRPAPWCGPDPLKQAADALADALTVIRLAQSAP